MRLDRRTAMEAKPVADMGIRCSCAHPAPVCGHCGGDVAASPAASQQPVSWDGLTPAQAQSLLQQARALTEENPIVTARRRARQERIDEALERLTTRR